MLRWPGWMPGGSGGGCDGQHGLGDAGSKEQIGAKEARRARQQSERERSRDRKRSGQPGHQGKGLRRDSDPGERTGG